MTHRWTANDLEQAAAENHYEDLDGGDIDMTAVEMNELAAMLRQAAETERRVTALVEWAQPDPQNGSYTHSPAAQ